MNKFLLGILFLLTTFITPAQNADASAPQMADQFRQDGKIYVVITVISIVFICIVLFLAYIERKLKKLEGEMKDRV